MMLALRNGADYRRKEFPAMVAIASAGWAVNHFSSLGFPYVQLLRGTAPKT
jgi:hypothetical protein